MTRTTPYRSPSPASTLAAALLLAPACADDVGSTDGTSEASTGAPTETTAQVTTSEATTVNSSDGSTSTDAADGATTDSTTDGEANALDDDAIARIHAAVEQSLGTGFATGCAVALWRDGEVIYAEGFGTKDEAGNPVTNDTLFQIGSDTKKMTAMTVLQLVDAGELSLDQSVGEVLPMLELAQSPAHLDSTTVHDLLSHQSGLWDYTPWIEGAADSELAALAYGPFATNEVAMMPAGLAWNYSNPNFSLAALVVEQVGGQSWADVVIDEVAAPLGMAQTYARRDDVIAASTDVASGFGPIFPDGINSFDLLELLSIEPDPPGWITPEEQADHAFTRPAGLLWATASDMARLEGFLLEGDPQVLSEASHAALVGAQVGLYPGVDPVELGYAYGLFSQRGFGGLDGGFYDVPLLSHGGNTLSMTSTTLLLPEQNVAVSVLANGSNEDSNLIALVALEEAAAGRLPAPSEPYDPFEPPRADLSVYAGDFTETFLGDITIGFDGANATIDIPLLSDLGVDVSPVLTPIYRDLFVLTIDGSQIDLSFYDGTVPFEHVVNRNFVFERTLEPMAPMAPVSPELARAWVRRVTEPRPRSWPRTVADRMR